MEIAKKLLSQMTLCHFETKRLWRTSVYQLIGLHDFTSVLFWSTQSSLSRVKRTYLCCRAWLITFESLAVKMMMMSRPAVAHLARSPLNVPCMQFITNSRFPYNHRFVLRSLVSISPSCRKGFSTTAARMVKDNETVIEYLPYILPICFMMLIFIGSSMS